MPGETEILERQVASAKAEARRFGRQYEATVEQYSHLQKKYESVKRDHKVTQRNLGNEVCRVAALNNQLQEKLQVANKKIEEQRLEVLDFKMQNAEFKVRVEFLESERRRRPDLMVQKNPSRLPVPATYKPTGLYSDTGVLPYARSTAASRARTGSYTGPLKTRPLAPAAYLGLRSKSFSSIAAGSRIPRAVSASTATSSIPSQGISSYLALPSQALGSSAGSLVPPPLNAKRILTPALQKTVAFISSPPPSVVSDTASISTNPEMTQGYYGADDLLSRGPTPVPSLNASPAPSSTALPSPTKSIVSTLSIKDRINQLKKNATAGRHVPFMSTTRNFRPASCSSVNDDDLDVWHGERGSILPDENVEKQKVKHSKGFQDAVVRSLPYMKPEERVRILSEAFL